MRNRAKCKLCKDILESFHRNDMVSCSCGEISIDGGDHYFKCSARNFANFLRIDDNGQEVAVRLEDEKEKEPEEPIDPSSKENLLEMLDNLIKSIEELPKSGLYSPVNHADLLSVLVLLSALFKSG